MRYLVKTTAGYTFVFRNVLEFKYTAAEAHIFVQLEGRKMNINGVTEIEADGDFEPWASSMEMIPPKTDGETAKAEEETPIGDHSTEDAFEFRREPSVPVELASTTFAPLERLNSGQSSIDDERAKTSLPPLDCVGVDDGETAGKTARSFASGGIVGRTGSVPTFYNTEYVFPSCSGACPEAIKRIEGAIRESDLRLRSTVIATVSDARKRGMVH